MTVILTDRSRIETYEKCPRERYWRYEYRDRGLERIDALKLDARIGTWVHNGIEAGLCDETDDNNSWKHASTAGLQFCRDCYDYVDWDGCGDQIRYDVTEGGEIVTALVYAYLTMKSSRLMQDGEILAIEQELTKDFTFGEDTVRFMARPDILWRRRVDGTVFIRNIKTVRDPDRMAWREKWPLDMQTLSEPLVVDDWLAANGYDQCGGVIIDGLVTGAVTKDRITGLYQHNNPLVYAWHVAETDAFYPRYEWQCTEPHRMGNGHKCAGGRSHKLSGARKVRVAETYPGGIIGWIDWLLANDPMVIGEMLIELPPIMRDEYQIARWQRMVMPLEAGLPGLASWAELRDQLDYAFPMHTSNANCLMPGRCECYDLCHGTAAADPLGSGLYRLRVPNHAVERESHDEAK